jgi:hypothetical protein
MSTDEFQTVIEASAKTITQEGPIVNCIQDQPLVFQSLFIY